MILRITPRNRFSSLLELDGVNWGILPNRMLPPPWGPDSEGDVDADLAAELSSLLGNRAFTLLLDYLAKAERSERQCRLLLQRKKFHPSLIDAALERCRELNYLSDARFAELLIRSYLERSASRRAVIAKLREQRIAAPVWEPLLAELYDKQQAASSLRELMDKYRATHRDLPPAKLREKTFTHFYRKGFDLEDIQAAWEDSR